jgi:hypothetical protein
MNLEQLLEKATPELPPDGCFLSWDENDEVWTVQDRVGQIGCDQIAQVETKERAQLIALAPDLARLVLTLERECDYGGCHVCGYKPGRGHAPDCALIALNERLSKSG